MPLRLRFETQVHGNACGRCIRKCGKPEQLKRALLKLPEVVSCHHVSGEGTFEIEVIATDLEAYSVFVREVLINLPHVKDLHTSFSLGEVKASSTLPLGHLSG